MWLKRLTQQRHLLFSGGYSPRPKAGLAIGDSLSGVRLPYLLWLFHRHVIAQGLTADLISLRGKAAGMLVSASPAVC
jgi:hypothetical protein